MAKSEDYTPDLTSEAYWRAHDIVIVRVVTIGRDPVPGHELVTLQVVRQISDRPVPPTFTTARHLLWFGPVGTASPVLHVNDLLLLYASPVPRARSAAVLLPARPEDSPAAQTAIRIALLRRAPDGADSIIEGVFDADVAVSLYCLHRLLDAANVQLSNDVVARLRQLRDRPGADSRVRVLASDLADRATKTPLLSAAQYAWLRNAFVASQAVDWQQLRPFTDRLLDFSDRRSDTVAFLTHVAQDSSYPQAVRIAAYSTFSDPRVVHYQNPDTVSDTVFQTLVRLLKDKEPLYRRASGVLLQNLSARIPPAVAGRYVALAANALDAASAAEGDEVTRAHLSHFRQLLPGAR